MLPPPPPAPDLLGVFAWLEVLLVVATDDDDELIELLELLEFLALDESTAGATTSSNFPKVLSMPSLICTSNSKVDVSVTAGAVNCNLNPDMLLSMTLRPDTCFHSAVNGSLSASKA
jgi:hypothetical protein